MKNNQNINRGEMNFLPSIKISNPKAKVTNSNSISSKPIIKETKNKNNCNKQITKYQSMSKLIVSKIDDLLDQYPNSKAASNSIVPYTEVYSNSKSLIANFDDRNMKLDLNTEDNKNSEKVEKFDSKKPEIKEKQKKKKKTALAKKDTFMTNVGIEENFTPKVETKQPSKYIEEHDKKIKEMIDDFDDIDNFLNEDDERDYLSSHPEDRDEVMYFKNLINEVDSYRKNVKEEYDELQYLIKFVEDTRGRLNRHKSGVSNLFNQIGYKAPAKVEDSDEESGGHVYYDEGNYDRRKNISKVKDNLINVQDKVINFYQNFNQKMKYVEKANKETYRSNKEFYRAATSDAKIRNKSKPK